MSIMLTANLVVKDNKNGAGVLMKISRQIQIAHLHILSINSSLGSGGGRNCEWVRLVLLNVSVCTFET